MNRKTADARRHARRWLKATESYRAWQKEMRETATAAIASDPELRRLLVTLPFFSLGLQILDVAKVQRGSM